MRPLPLPLALVAGLLATACAKPNPARAEAGRVIEEIDRIGSTPAAARPPLLDDLARRELAETDVRRVRDLCVDAYRKLAEAKAAADAAGEVEGDPTVPGVRLEMTKRLLAAQESQTTATKRHEGCRTALGALRAKTPR